MACRGDPIEIDQYFAERDPLSRELFDAVRTAIVRLGSVEVCPSKSQIAFWRRTAFAWTWVPEQYLQADDLAPLVLSIGLHRHSHSARWKQVVEPHRGRFMHHLELRDVAQLDAELLGWLHEAWEEAR